MAQTTIRRTDRTEATDGMSSGWGPVLSGAAAAFLTFITFSALWMAIAASGSQWMANNLEWFELFTALGAAPVGGFVAGRLQRGETMSGMIRGFATWGLVLLAGLIIGVPATTALFAGATNITLQSLTQGGDVVGSLSQISGNLWATFVIFGGGGILAAMAGGAGAAMAPSGGEHREVHREEMAPDGHRERELTGTRR